MWLFSFRPNVSWPADLIAHLQSCTACRQVQTQLKQIDQGVNEITSTPGSASAKVKLLARVAATPQQAKPATPAPTQDGSWWRLGGFLIGAAALIAFGWVLGHFSTPEAKTPEPIETTKTVEVIREKLVEVYRDKIVPASPDRELIAALVKRNARLVKSAQARERLEALLDMADDCRHHARGLIDHGPREMLPTALDLYNRLLREGVLRQLQQAPMSERGVLEPIARARLEKMVEPLATMIPLPALLEEQRGMLNDAARDVLEQSKRLEGGPVAIRRPQAGDSASPAATLVQFAVTYSAESDPVVKADMCSDCVQRLMPYMMMHLAEEATPQRADVGEQFGEMIRFGIYGPLEAASAKMSPPAAEQVSRIILTTQKALDAMEKNLEKAPEPARPALERAIEAAGKSEKSKGKGKGKQEEKGKGKKQEEKGRDDDKEKGKKKAEADGPSAACGLALACVDKNRILQSTRRRDYHQLG